MGSSGSSLACLALLAAAPSMSAPDLCEPGPEIARAIDEALAAAPGDAPYEERMAPLRALRVRFERELFVHLRYQDAIFDQGIEGHLKEMLEEYLGLQAKHAGDPLFLYLSGRAFEGRGTKRAIAIMEQVLALDPGFAPAQRTLAEIYGRSIGDRVLRAIGELLPKSFRGEDVVGWWSGAEFMIGMYGSVLSPLIRFATSFPSIFGIITSSRIRSGGDCATSFSAVSPSAAVMVR